MTNEQLSEKLQALIQLDAASSEIRALQEILLTWHVSAQQEGWDEDTFKSACGQYEAWCAVLNSVEVRLSTLSDDLIPTVVENDLWFRSRIFVKSLAWHRKFEMVQWPDASASWAIGMRAEVGPAPSVVSFPNSVGGA